MRGPAGTGRAGAGGQSGQGPGRVAGRAGRLAAAGPAAELAVLAAESHSAGVGAEKTGAPVTLSVAVRFPARPVASLSRVVLTRSRSARTAGFAAAAAFLTTSTSLKPPSADAVIRRSTPGSTSRYVAVGPARTGDGRVVGHHSDRA